MKMWKIHHSCQFLDLCQEVKILLFRFKASLKAGINRGGLSFFLFSFSITMTSFSAASTEVEAALVYARTK